MIISLYESNYPIEKEGTPNWEELPDGYFTAEFEDVHKAILDLPSKFKGEFTQSKDGIKPRVGEHLLAVFTLDGGRYLCNTTLSYGSETDVIDLNKWEAYLGISSLIRKW